MHSLKYGTSGIFQSYSQVVENFVDMWITRMASVNKIFNLTIRLNLSWDIHRQFTQLQVSALSEVAKRCLLRQNHVKNK